MGGLISTLGNLFGGSSASTDRQQQLKGYGDLSNIFNFGFNQGKSTFGTGVGAEKAGLEQLGGPEAYYQKLLSGNRAAAMSAVAPTVNAINSQTDAAARQAGTMGTARGGGANATEQQVDTGKQAAVEQAITGAREGAAPGAAAVAGETAKIGGSMADQAARLLGLSSSAATNLTDIASGSRATSNALHRQKAQDAQQLASMIADLAFG